MVCIPTAVAAHSAFFARFLACDSLNALSVPIAQSQNLKKEPYEPERGRSIDCVNKIGCE